MRLIDPERSRAQQQMLRNERLVAEVLWHPVRLTGPAVTFVAAVVAWTWLATLVPADSVLLDGAGAAVLAALGFLGYQVVEWWYERLLVTDRRIVMVTGLLTRRTAVMPLKKVTDMTYERPFVGRLPSPWGWGTFVMESAGQHQALHRLTHLPCPDELFERLSQELFQDDSYVGRSARVVRGASRAEPRFRPVQGTEGHHGDEPTVFIRVRDHDD